MEDGKILVTGGAGYIGSHAVRQLIKAGFHVIVIDNLSTGHIGAIDSQAEVVIGDIRDLGLLDAVFAHNKIIGVMQFAAKIIVPESVVHPLSYYNDNFTGVLAVLRTMVAYHVQNIVFSSTAAVYGSSDEAAITEKAPLHPESPYGFSKLAAERMIIDCESAYGIRHCIFRYFNVAGAAEDASIGEAHPVETHIIPVTVDASLSGKQMTVFGNDYKTRDGTNLRDYIHVLDLANAHVLGMQMLLNGGKSDIFNLGSETGYTNKEIVETVGKVTGKPVKYVFGSRRAGDADAIVASNVHAKEILGWAPTRNLEVMIASDVAWRNKHPELFGATRNKLPTEAKKNLLVYVPSRNTKNLNEAIETEDQDRLEKIQTTNGI